MALTGGVEPLSGVPPGAGVAPALPVGAASAAATGDNGMPADFACASMTLLSAALAGTSDTTVGEPAAAAAESAARRTAMVCVVDGAPRADRPTATTTPSDEPAVCPVRARAAASGVAAARMSTVTPLAPYARSALAKAAR